MNTTEFANALHSAKEGKTITLAAHQLSIDYDDPLYGFPSLIDLENWCNFNNLTLTTGLNSCNETTYIISTP